MDGWVSRRALTVFVAACLLALPASAAADQGGIAEFSVPTPNAYPGPITAGPDDTMWFTESGATQIGEITPTGEVTEYPVAPEGTLPGSITLGPDGNLWFTENLGGYIGRMTPTGTLTKFSGTPGASVAIPLGITAGPGGGPLVHAEPRHRAGRGDDHLGRNPAVHPVAGDRAR